MEEKHITLAWKELSIYIPLKKAGLLDYREKHHRFQRIVQNVTGVAYPGELIAIMGSPPLANSIFLKVLASKASSEVSVTGQIVANGMGIQQMGNQVSGYLEREEVFFENITIKQHLLCQARLRMDRRLADFERKRRVQQLLDECDLQGFKDFPIKRIPNVLRIRLSLATEMLTDPQILFCDEPNSGMDPAETNNLVQGLRDIANSGKTVICTFQKLPARSLDDVDELLLLADGQLAFTGSPRDAIRFLDNLDYVCPKNFSVTDYFLNTLAIHPGRERECKQQIREICASHNSSYLMKDLANRVDLEIDRDSSDIMSTTRGIKCPSAISRISWIVHRYFVNYASVGSLQLFKILQIVVTGIIIGLCFFGAENHTSLGIQARKGFLFILVNECIFRTLLFNQSPDLQVFVRESKAGLYDAGSYVIAKICFKLPIAALETLLMVTTSYLLAGLDLSIPVFLYTCLILFIANITSTAFAFAFTTIWSRNILNSSLNPFHVFLWVTSGVFITWHSIRPPISWIRYLSLMFYTYESLAIVHFENIQYISCEPNPAWPCYRTGEEVLSESGLLPGNFRMNLIILVAIYVALNLIAYFALVIRSFKL